MARADSIPRVARRRAAVWSLAEGLDRHIALAMDGGATSCIEPSGIAVVVLRPSVISCLKGPVPEEGTLAVLLFPLDSRNELVVEDGP